MVNLYVPAWIDDPTVTETVTSTLDPGEAGLALCGSNWISGPDVEFVKVSFDAKVIVAVVVNGWLVVTESVMLVVEEDPLGEFNMSRVWERAIVKLPVMSGIHVPVLFEPQ